MVPHEKINSFTLHTEEFAVMCRNREEEDNWLYVLERVGEVHWTVKVFDEEGILVGYL